MIALRSPPEPSCLDALYWIYSRVEIFPAAENLSRHSIALDLMIPPGQRLLHYVAEKSSKHGLVLELRAIQNSSSSTLTSLAEISMSLGVGFGDIRGCTARTTPLPLILSRWIRKPSVRTGGAFCVAPISSLMTGFLWNRELGAWKMDKSKRRLMTEPSMAKSRVWK